jgi:hypothetical protein
LICTLCPPARDTTALQLGCQSQKAEAPLLQVASFQALPDFFLNEGVKFLPVLPRGLRPPRRYQCTQVSGRFCGHLKLLDDLGDVDRLGGVELSQAFAVKSEGIVQRCEGREGGRPR